METPNSSEFNPLNQNAGSTPTGSAPTEGAAAGNASGQTAPLAGQTAGWATETPSASAGKKNNVLIPLLAGVVVLLLIVIAYMMMRGTSGSTANPAAATAETSAAENSANEQAQQPQQQQAPDKAPVITDAKTLELLQNMPRRNPNDPLALGPVDAPLVITMWEDFACPMCTKFELDSFDTIRKYADEGKVRIEWRDLTIFAQQYKSDLAAIAARAAANQGKFWEFAHAAYHSAGQGNHPSYDDQKILDLAKEIGIADMAKFQKDLKDPALRKAVEDDTAYAQQIGINGTPFFIIGDTYISGAYPTQYFVNTIEDRLANMKPAPKE